MILIRLIILIGVLVIACSSYGASQNENNSSLNEIEPVKDIDVDLRIMHSAYTTAIFNVNEPELEATELIYGIFVSNPGEVRMKDVNLDITLNKGMIFENASYRNRNDGLIEKPKRHPMDYDDSKGMILTWTLGTLDPGEIKAINLRVYAKIGVDETKLKSEVMGLAPDGTSFRDSSDFATWIRRETIEE